MCVCVVCVCVCVCCKILISYNYSHQNVSGYYRVSTYFLAKVFCDLIPIRVIPVMIYCSIIYWMVGTYAPDIYLARVVCLCSILYAKYFTSFGLYLDLLIYKSGYYSFEGYMHHFVNWFLDSTSSRMFVYMCAIYVMCTCMYACMYCMYVHTYVCMYVCICMYVLYVCMHVCMYVCMYYVRTYICMYVYMYACT